MALSMAIASGARAQGGQIPTAAPAAGTIGVIDMKRVIDASPAFLKGKQRVITELAAIEAKLRTDETALVALKQKREAEAAIMNKQQLEQLVRTIDVSERALKRGREDFNQRKTLRTNEIVRDLDRQLGDLIAEVAKAKGVDAVLSTSATVYANPKLDLTEAVIARLKAQNQAQPPAQADK
jgi:outer membrane protein